MTIYCEYTICCFSFLQACCEPYGVLRESGLGRCFSMFDDHTCAMGPSCSNPDPRTKNPFLKVCCWDVLLFPTRATIEPEAAAIWKVWDSPEALKIHVSNLIRTCFEIGNETTRQWEVHLRNPLVIICSIYIYIQTFVLSQHLPHLQHWFEVWRILLN